MRAILAALPIVAVLVLMVGLRWPAARAGAVCLAASILLGAVAFDFGTGLGGVGPGVAGVAAEAAFISATVLGILFPALAIHNLQVRTGATTVLRDGLARLAPDPRMSAVLIAWFFALFLEGAAGFGTPVALAAPFLVAIGLRPITAVVAALVGHAAGVSFGAVGTPVIAQAGLTGFTTPELARATAPYHAALGWFLAGVVVVLVSRALPGRAVPWSWAAIAALTFFAPYTLIAFFVGAELPTMGGAVVGLAAFLILARRVGPRRPVAARAGGTPGAGVGEAAPVTRTAPLDRGALLRAASPYLALMAVVLFTRLVPPVQRALFDVVVEWRTGAGFSGSFRPLYHPGMLLTLALLVGALAQHATRTQLVPAVLDAGRQLAGVVVALVSLVGIARLMSHAGMTEELASAAAETGRWWPLLAPAVGALGTFVTGSATASNILFTELQTSTAESAGFPARPLLGAQGFGAAVGNIICPHNVVAASATVGLVGAEGQVLRRTLWVALVYVAAGGVLALLLAG